MCVTYFSNTNLNSIAIPLYSKTRRTTLAGSGLWYSFNINTGRIVVAQECLYVDCMKIVHVVSVVAAALYLQNKA